MQLSLQKSIQESPHSNPKTLILLVNLGSPKKPTAFQIGLFLKQFLFDKYVVKRNRILWIFILFLFIIPIRSFKLIKLYNKIWLKEGSPLTVYTHRLAKRCEDKLSRYFQCNFSVCPAMTYGKDRIKQIVPALLDDSISSLIVLPLFPQYSTTTTLPIYSELTKTLLKKNNGLPTLSFITHYYNDQTYLNALAHSIQEHWQRDGRMDRLLFSFHGLPKREIMEGDPYLSHCQQTAQGVAQILNLPENYWKIAFQSRFGKAWCEPSIETQFELWIKEGVQNISIIAPSFAVDCLETLEELEIRSRAVFLKMGGNSLHYIPALNDTDRHVDVLIGLIKKYF